MQGVSFGIRNGRGDSAVRSTSAFGARVTLILCCLVPANRLRAETNTSDRNAPAVAPIATASQDKLPHVASTGAQLVHGALAAEARGDVLARGDLLREAIASNPSYPPAHWHSGEVRSDGQWLSIDAATAATISSGTMDQYRALRSRTANTATAHMKLAQWCAAVGLKDQERTHLLYASTLRPTQKQRREVFSKLGLVPYRGLFLAQSQVDALKHQAIDGPTLKRERIRLMTSIKRDLARHESAGGESAWTELRSTPGPIRVAVLESILQEQGLPTAVAEEGIAILAAEPGQTGTDSLVRQAVFGQQESLRKAAAQALKAKSVFAYVPTLVGALRSPVDVQFQVYWIGNVPRHDLFMYQQGPKADYSFASIGGGRFDVDVTTHPISHRPTEVRVNLTPDGTLNADAMRAQQAIAENEAHATLNQRIGAALNIATDNHFDDVTQWWDWWNDYNEMYQPPYKPLVQAQSFTALGPGSIHVHNVSCFVAGTGVWTATGPMPIEQLRPGDSVLAQDPDSGELAYKPVFATTVRPPSATIEITTDTATIRATKGHPFWVDGIGWQMAKELKAGQELHCPRGPIKIKSMGEQLEAECYNLVVADFNTYFVSDAQVLVHDNNLREVTTAIVPGLVDP
jgi:hypothetical protein